MILNDFIYHVDRIQQKEEMIFYYRGSVNYVMIFSEINYLNIWKEALRKFKEEMENPSPVLKQPPIPPPLPPLKRKLRYLDPPEDQSCPIAFLPTELLIIFFSQQTIKSATSCRSVCKLWLLLLDNKWLKQQIRSNSPLWQLPVSPVPPVPPVPQLSLLDILINIRGPIRFDETDSEGEDWSWED